MGHSKLNLILKALTGSHYLIKCRINIKMETKGSPLSAPVVPFENDRGLNLFSGYLYWNLQFDISYMHLNQIVPFFELTGLSGGIGFWQPRHEYFFMVFKRTKNYWRSWLK